MSQVRNYESITDTPPVVVNQPMPEEPEIQAEPQPARRERFYFTIPDYLLPPEPKESTCLKVCKPCCLFLQAFACLAEVCCVVCNIHPRHHD